MAFRNNGAGSSSMDSMTRERTTANSTSSGLAARFFPLPTACEVMSKHAQYLIFNGLVRCVSADRAPTYQAADRRKTRPSDREAGARLGGHDPPTPRDRAERSARA